MAPIRKKSALAKIDGMQGVGEERTEQYKGPSFVNKGRSLEHRSPQRSSPRFSPKRFAVFDVDGTLFRSSLLIELAEELIDSGVFEESIRDSYAKEKEAWQNRQGPGIVQPWYDVLKYLNRESVISEHASWIYRVTPYVYFGAHLAAAGMVPMFVARTPLTSVGDAIVLVGLFALARFALSLAAGATFGEAARLANFAGGLVVMKRGTATVSASELLEKAGTGVDLWKTPAK